MRIVPLEIATATADTHLLENESVDSPASPQRPKRRVDDTLSSRVRHGVGIISLGHDQSSYDFRAARS